MQAENWRLLLIFFVVLFTFFFFLPSAKETLEEVGKVKSAFESKALVIKR